MVSSVYRYTSSGGIHGGANRITGDPTPEESARILAESAITILKDEAPKGQEGL